MENTDHDKKEKQKQSHLEIHCPEFLLDMSLGTQCASYVNRVINIHIILSNILWISSISVSIDLHHFILVVIYLWMFHHLLIQYFIAWYLLFYNFTSYLKKLKYFKDMNLFLLVWLSLNCLLEKKFREHLYGDLLLCIYN